MIWFAATRVCAASATALALIAVASPAAAQTAPLEGLDAYIEKVRAEWQVPGLAVAIVKDDRIVYAKGFGTREIGKDEPVDPDTVFAIGSASKAFTGAALAMLVDEKKIGWDGAVHDYMPAFRLDDPYITRHATVRDLLSHRTGYISGYGWVWTGSGFSRDQVIGHLRYQTRLLGFRDRFAYANEMFTVAGEIVPAVTGITWDAFLAKRIFAPLGMTRTSTSITALKGMSDVALPHGEVDGRLTSFPYRNIDNVGGAGAINSTVRDLAQWVRLQLNEGMYAGKRLIAADTIEETHSGQVVPRGGFGSSAPGAKFAEYGLGWMVDDYRGAKVVQHAGAVDGMLGVVGMIPERKLGVVVLSNRFPHQATWAIELKVFDAFLGGGTTDWSARFKAEDVQAKRAQEQRRRTEAAAPARPATLPLDRYVGRYASKLSGTATVAMEKEGLVFRRPAAAAALVHDRDNRFRARWTSAGIASVFGETPVGFTIGSDGNVASLTLGDDRFDREEPAATGE